MKKITLTNSLGESLQLTNTSPFLLNKFEESNSINIYTSKGMSQNGNTYLGNTLDQREITLEVTIIAESSEKLINHKDRFNKVFNPQNNELWLTYQDDVKTRKVKCISNKLPYFTSIKNSVSKCLISLTANNPFWQETMEIKEEIAAWIGDFEFDLEIPSETGIELGHREPSLIVNINNNGNIECGMRVEFKALATLENPSLLNVNTSEYIKINKTMLAGEIITVKTYFGNKSVESSYNGVVSNAFNYIDFQSTFIQLSVGDNLIRYDADSNIENLEVSVYYIPQYLGV